jgi:hypothetical protein
LTPLQLGFLHHWLPSPQANGEGLEGADGAAAAEALWTSAFMEPGSSSLLAQHTSAFMEPGSSSLLAQHTSAFMEPGSSSLLAQHSYEHDCRPLQVHYRGHERLGDARLYFPPISSTAEQFHCPNSSPLNLLQDELLQVVVRRVPFFALLRLVFFWFCF